MEASEANQAKRVKKAKSFDLPEPDDNPSMKLLVDTLEQVFAEDHELRPVKRSIISGGRDEKLQSFVLGIQPTPIKNVTDVTEADYEKMQGDDKIVLDGTILTPSVTKHTLRYKNLTKTLCHYLNRHLERVQDDDFTYTTIQINRDVQATVHEDKNNLGASYIATLGEFTPMLILMLQARAKKENYPPLQR